MKYYYFYIIYTWHIFKQIFNIKQLNLSTIMVKNNISIKFTNLYYLLLYNIKKNLLYINKK